MRVLKRSPLVQMRVRCGVEGERQLLRRGKLLTLTSQEALAGGRSIVEHGHQPCRVQGIGRLEGSDSPGVAKARAVTVPVVQGLREAVDDEAVLAFEDNGWVPGQRVVRPAGGEGALAEFLDLWMRQGRGGGVGWNGERHRGP